jgi:hypothetical protein
MQVSQARVEANRRNALLSTGPKTPEGKAISRANSLKHGLCSSMVNPEDAHAIMSRARDFFDTLRPQNHFHCFLVNEVALISFKIERSERMDRRVRDKIAIKAELGWDDDKRIEAELLGEQLGNRPAVVVEQLRKTPQGCEWLMGRWALLAYVADQGKGWTPEQDRLAFDLMATPADFREGFKPGVSLDFRGKVIDEAAVARREIDELDRRRAAVRELDEANQALAMADLYDDSDPELKRLRKYEGMLHGRLRWCIRQLQEDAPPKEAPRWLKQRWLGDQQPAPTPEPTPSTVAPTCEVIDVRASTLPEPATIVEPPMEYEPHGGHRLPDPHPPFDLEPDEFPEPGQSADIPQILANRREKKLKKDEAVRETRRQQVKDLLA